MFYERSRVQVFCVKRSEQSPSFCSLQALAGSAAGVSAGVRTPVSEPGSRVSFRPPSGQGRPNWNVGLGGQKRSDCDLMEAADAAGGCAASDARGERVVKVFGRVGVGGCLG